MIKYVFEDEQPTRIKNAKRANPQKLGEAISKLEGEKPKSLPKALVEAARARAHPAHPHFTWDDALAAEERRLDQARELIRIVLVVDESISDEPIRAFPSFSVGERREHHNIQDVMKNSDLMEAMLRQAERDLQSFEDRYRTLDDVCKHVRKARDAVTARRRSRARAGDESRPTA